MKEMKHPNVLGIDFVRAEDNYIHLCLPFSRGGDLDKCFRKKVVAPDVKLDEKQILFWAMQIILAVGYFHSK